MPLGNNLILENNRFSGTLPSEFARLNPINQYEPQFPACALTNTQACTYYAGLPPGGDTPPGVCDGTPVDSNRFDCPLPNWAAGSWCAGGGITCRPTLESTAWNRGQPWDPRPLGADNRAAAAERREAQGYYRHKQAMEQEAKQRARQEKHHPAK